MATEDLQELALKVKAAYADNPTFTINLVCSHIGECTVDEVAAVLDEFLVTEDGVEHVGPGQGGGWAPSIQPTFEPVDLGYRWPDGSLRQDPFDYNNPDHRAEMASSVGHE